MRKILLTGLTTVALIAATALAAMPASAVGALKIVAPPGTKVSSDDCKSAGNIDPPFTTIQSAVDDAVNGDTILICPGTYAESISTDKQLTFDALADDKGSINTSEWDTTGGYALELIGAGTIVEGITFGAASGAVNPAGVEMSGNSITVTRNSFDSLPLSLDIDADDAMVTNNELTNFDDPVVGITVSQISNNLVIKQNDFEADYGIAAIDFTNSGASQSEHPVIDGNFSSQFNGSFAALQGTHNAEVTNNSVGIGNSTTPIIWLFGNDSDYLVQGNNVGPYPLTSAVGISGSNNGGGSIISNYLYDTAWGVTIDDTIAATVHIHGNAFIDAKTGAIDNASPATVDAINNYYGCDTGPGTTDCALDNNANTGSLTDSPWLVLTTSVAKSSIAKGTTTTFSADLNHNSQGAIITDHVLDNALTVSFTFSQGTANPTGQFFVGGKATTTLTGTTVGSGSATATVGTSAAVEPTSSQPVTVTAPTSLPALTVHDASTAEGNSGTHGLAFKVTLSKKATSAVTLHFTTANSSALAGSDFIAKSGVLTIAKGKTTGTITILIKGDKAKEANESFAVNIFNASSNARIADAVGTGVIRNDDH